MTTEALNYAIDEQDRLIKVDGGYYSFAEENGWSEAGTSLGALALGLRRRPRDEETAAAAAATHPRRGRRR